MGKRKLGFVCAAALLLCGGFAGEAKAERSDEISRFREISIYSTRCLGS